MPSATSAPRVVGTDSQRGFSRAASYLNFLQIARIFASQVVDTSITVGGIGMSVVTSVASLDGLTGFWVTTSNYQTQAAGAASPSPLSATPGLYYLPPGTGSTVTAVYTTTPLRSVTPYGGILYAGGPWQDQQQPYTLARFTPATGVSTPDWVTLSLTRPWSVSGVAFQTSSVAWVADAGSVYDGVWQQGGLYQITQSGSTWTTFPQAYLPPGEVSDMRLV
jgi:hypothetical protein